MPDEPTTIQTKGGAYIGGDVSAFNRVFSSMALIPSSPHNHTSGAMLLNQFLQYLVEPIERVLVIVLIQ